MLPPELVCGACEPQLSFELLPEESLLVVPSVAELVVPVSAAVDDCWT